ncbi:MAG: hypothetical protein JXB45_05595 [Candidatus Krumholzibacteriota bacterium]|nr:hypothetical protein [Candidatus Krumholzibacteriota bacterium]
MRRKPTTIILLGSLMLLFSGRIFAQSVFGLNFLGEHRFRGSARSVALGYSALALPDTNNAITMNTASLADLTSVTFSLYEVLGMSSVGYGEKKVDQNRFQLPSALLAVPLRKGLVLGLGYRTRFSGRGDFAFRRSVTDSPALWEVYKLHSSLFSVPFSLSGKVGDWLKLGGELQIDRGGIKDEVAVLIPREDYRTVYSFRNRRFSATSWAGFLQLQVHPRVSLGIGYDGQVEYSVEERIDYDYVALDSTASWDFTLPAAFSAGIAVNILSRWYISSTFWMRDAPYPSGYKQFEGILSDERLLAFGIERQAEAEGGFFSRVPLRLGYYENRWHLQFPAGEQVISRFFTLGSGYPMPGGPGSLDFVCEFGKIGSVDRNRVDETVFRFGLSLSVSEKWSRRKVVTH